MVLNQRKEIIQIGKGIMNLAKYFFEYLYRPIERILIGLKTKRVGLRKSDYDYDYD